VTVAELLSARTIVSEVDARIVMAVVSASTSASDHSVVIAGHFTTAITTSGRALVRSAVTSMGATSRMTPRLEVSKKRKTRRLFCKLSTQELNYVRHNKWA